MQNTKDHIKLFIEGDKQAYQIIYNQFKPLVYGIAIRYTRCKDDAQDVFQESFIKIYEKRETYNPKYPIVVWIKKITINCALLHIRKYHKLVLIENQDTFENEDTEYIEDIDISELKKKLLQVLNELPQGYKLVFNLYVIDNLSHQEIAEQLNISETTSRTQLHKAKKMISKILEKQKNYEKGVG